MKLELALRMIAETHGHLDRSEMYRGYRSLPVWLTGVCALVATALQLRLFPPVTPLDFVWFWVGVAGVCSGIGAWGGRSRSAPGGFRRTASHASGGGAVPARPRGRVCCDVEHRPGDRRAHLSAPRPVGGDVRAGSVRVPAVSAPSDRVGGPLSSRGRCGPSSDEWRRRNPLSVEHGCHLWDREGRDGSDPLLAYRAARL